MKPILKYPGSKWRMAQWIIDHFPENYENMTYLEPFFGSGSIFFNKERSRIETINDMDSDVINLFKMVRQKPAELAYLVSMTPWSRSEYKDSYVKTDDELEKARRFIVRMWQAIGAKSSDKTGWRNNIDAQNRTIQGFNLVLPETIMQVCVRLQHSKKGTVQIENQDVFRLFERYDRDSVLMYLDPPYVLSTRSKRIYKHEFTDADHIRLLKLCQTSKAKIIISGYKCDLYDEYLAGWYSDSIIADCESGQKRTETIWMNYKRENVQLTIDELLGGRYEGRTNRIENCK